VTGGLIRFIRTQHSKQVLALIDEHLGEGEEVLHWSRVKDPQSKERGYVYLTKSRYILNWAEDRDPESTHWVAIESWGVNSTANGGPIVGIEEAERARFIQLPIVTSGAAVRVTEFLRSWGQLAPDGASPRIGGEELGPFTGPEAATVVEPHRNLVRRVLFTILGVLLIIAAILTGWLPGPGGIPLAIAGFWVLAKEYDWAEDALDWMKDKYREAKRKIQQRRAEKRERRAGKRA
jgi:Putative transmembrane protein (PGPGW)